MSEGATSEALEDLLRRSHRDELFPLARELGIKPAGMGRDTLASAIARSLRRRGANDIANLFLRRGEGPAYETVLRDLSVRHQIEPGTSAEEAEAAIARWWIASAWASLGPEAREAAWARLDMAPPLPETGPEALAWVRARHERRSTYLMSAVALTVAVTRIVPVLGCFAVVWLARPRDETLIPAVLEVHRLRQVVRHRVTVGVVGSPSSGKDAAIRAIFGIDSGNVDPVAGSTKTVEITRLPRSTALYVVNTPGMGDVIEAVTEEAKQVLDHIDVYVYVLNAQGGVQAREKADWEACRATGRPALAVVNKVDTIRDADRERYLADARAKLAVSEEDFLAVAFDPLPQLSESPIGVDEVRTWIERHLTSMGKDPAELSWSAGAGG